MSGWPTTARLSQHFNDWLEDEMPASRWYIETLALNLHVARGSLAEWAFLRDGMGLPALDGLLALVISGSKPPLCVSWQ